MSPKGYPANPPAKVWTNYSLSRILNIRPSDLSRMRNGQQNPNISHLKKLEAVLGWPASEQIDLLPLEGLDPRWSMAFSVILNEWMEANPRETPVDDLVPLARSRARGGGRKKKV